MAYAVPFQWAHGDYPTAARLNLYKDGLDAIYGGLGDYNTNRAVAVRIGNVQGYYFIHRLRWLLHLGGGRIEDPNGVGETVTLTAGEGGNWASYDLSQVDWMVPGKLYQVQAVACCLEDVEGL
jgi:hypothetical protein